MRKMHIVEHEDGTVEVLADLEDRYKELMFAFEMYEPFDPIQQKPLNDDEILKDLVNSVFLQRMMGFKSVAEVNIETRRFLSCLEFACKVTTTLTVPEIKKFRRALKERPEEVEAWLKAWIKEKEAS